MLNLSNRSIAIYQGPIDAAEISAAFAEARKTSALILEVEVPLGSLTAGRSLLERMGFTVAGTVSGNETCVRFKKKIRDAGDGIAAVGRDPHLAVPAPVIPVSDVERLACELVSRLNTDGVEVRAAKLKADSIILAFDKAEVMPTFTFLERQNTKELEGIQLEIDKLMQKRSEP